MDLTVNEEAERVFAYTDGACLGNPGPGGWAAIMFQGEKRRTLSGHDLRTTNNRMEMTAAIEAISSMRTDAPLTIISDSKLLVDGATHWLENWKARGWRKADKAPVLNRDLWMWLDGLISLRPTGVQFEWTRGHAGTALNEKADRLAQVEAEKAATIERGRIKMSS